MLPRLAIALGLVVVVPCIGCGPRANGGLDAGGPTVLAVAAAANQSAPIDGIPCETNEQLLFHVHAHLAIYVQGVEKLVAAGIGIGPPLSFDRGFVSGGSCFSWLHTHDQTGIIHIESPTQRVFTLGSFFAIWGLTLAADHAGPATGAVTTFVNGENFPDDPAGVPLNPHDVIQLVVGAPAVSPMPYTFAAGL